MYTFFNFLLIVDSILIIIAVLMQPSKTGNALSSLSGGGNTGEGHKARGFEAFMQKTTTVLGVLFFFFALVLVYLSTK